MGRLRQPGTCTIFTTLVDLQSLSNGTNSYAREMADLLAQHRSPAAFKDAISDVLDNEGTTPHTGSTVGQAPFRFDIFQTFCHGLQVQVAELAQGGTCTFCVLLGRKDPKPHLNKDCPIAMSGCNRCYQTGHFIRYVRAFRSVCTPQNLYLTAAQVNL